MQEFEKVKAIRFNKELLELMEKRQEELNMDFSHYVRLLIRADLGLLVNEYDLVRRV